MSCRTSRLCPWVTRVRGKPLDEVLVRYLTDEDEAILAYIELHGGNGRGVDRRYVEHPVALDERRVKYFIGEDDVTENVLRLQDFSRLRLGWYVPQDVEEVLKDWS